MSTSIRGALGGFLSTSCGPDTCDGRCLRVEVEHSGVSVAVMLDWEARQNLRLALHNFDSHRDED